jgi:hypothetical protein
MSWDAQASWHVDVWRPDAQMALRSLVLLGKSVRAQGGGSNRQA